jgi:hypothetical protein
MSELRKFIKTTIREFLYESKNNYLNDIVFYHGSDVLFDKFDIDYTTNGNLGRGFYFTPVIGLAKQYGDIVYKVKLDISNPIYLNGVDSNFSDNEIIEIVNHIPQNIFNQNKDNYIETILSIDNKIRRNEEFIRNISFIDDRNINIFEKFGYDAIVGKEIDEVVVWNPNKIRIIK